MKNSSPENCGKGTGKRVITLEKFFFFFFFLETFLLLMLVLERCAMLMNKNRLFNKITKTRKYSYITKTLSPSLQPLSNLGFFRCLWTWKSLKTTSSSPSLNFVNASLRCKLIQRKFLVPTDHTLVKSFLLWLLLAKTFFFFFGCCCSLYIFMGATSHDYDDDAENGKWRWKWRWRWKARTSPSFNENCFSFLLTNLCEEI